MANLWPIDMVCHLNGQEPSYLQDFFSWHIPQSALCPGSKNLLKISGLERHPAALNKDQGFLWPGPYLAECSA